MSYHDTVRAMAGKPDATDEHIDEVRAAVAKKHGGADPAQVHPFLVAEALEKESE